MEVHPIGQDHVSKGALVLVVSIGLDGDFSPKGEVRGGLLGSLAVSGAFFRAVDCAQAASSARDLSEATEAV